MDPENFEALVALMYLVWCFWGNLDESKRPQMWAHVSADLWWILVRSRVLVASFMFFLCGIRCSRTRPFHNKAPQGKILAAKWQRNLSRLDMARSCCSEVVLADVFLVNVDLQLSTFASPDLLVRSASACLDRPEAFCWQCLLEGARGRMWECRDFSRFYGTNRACYSSSFCHILPWSSKSNRSIPCAEEACLLHIGTLPKVCFPWVASPSSCKHWKWSLSATTGASIRDSNEQDAYFLVR